MCNWKPTIFCIHKHKAERKKTLATKASVMYYANKHNAAFWDDGSTRLKITIAGLTVNRRTLGQSLKWQTIGYFHRESHSSQIRNCLPCESRKEISVTKVNSTWHTNKAYTHSSKRNHRVNASSCRNQKKLLRFPCIHHNGGRDCCVQQWINIAVTSKTFLKPNVQLQICSNRFTNVQRRKLRERREWLLSSHLSKNHKHDRSTAQNSIDSGPVSEPP